MVRATAAEILKLFGGVYPPPHDATSFGNLAAQVDTLMDTAALPGVLSATGTNEVALANRVGANLVMWTLWGLAGGDLSGKPEPVVMTQGIMNEIRLLLQDPDEDGWTTLDMIDESV